MASIRTRSRADGTPVWDVVFRKEDRRRTTRRFDSLVAAQAYAATKSGNGNRGNQARSAGDVTGYILRSSTVDRHGCWLWTGALTNAGYGNMYWKANGSGRPEHGAHRISYSVFVGPIASGLVIDHLCRVRHCVNPDHLEPVTQRENVLRSPIAPGALNAAKTHCAQGHPFSEENTFTVVNPGGRSTTTRSCKTCTRSWNRIASDKRRAVA